EALVTSTQALSEAGENLALRASLQLDIAFSNVCLGDMPTAVPQMAAAAELAERGGENPIVARALGALTITDYLCGNGLDDGRLARALSLEDPEFVSPWELRPRFEAALLLLWTMRLDEALSAFRELRREALERGDETVIPSLDLYLVLAALRS